LLLLAREKIKPNKNDTTCNFDLRSLQRIILMEQATQPLHGNVPQTPSSNNQHLPCHRSKQGPKAPITSPVVSFMTQARPSLGVLSSQWYILTAQHPSQRVKI